jgi:hypothetical protein
LSVVAMYSGNTVLDKCAQVAPVPALKTCSATETIGTLTSSAAARVKAVSQLGQVRRADREKIVRVTAMRENPRNGGRNASPGGTAIADNRNISTQCIAQRWNSLRGHNTHVQRR